MVSTRIGTAIAAVLLIPLLFPAALGAQEVSRMLARVQADGAPVSDLDFVVYTGGERRPVGTSGSSGLAVVEFSRVPLSTGTRLVAFAVTCDGRTEILMGSSAAALPLLDDACRQTNLGSIVWARTERVEIDLTDRPTMRIRTATAVVRDQYGLRFEVAPLVALMTGDFREGGGRVDPATGIGGEIVLGYDFDSGIGMGLGLGLGRHGLAGHDEMLSRWSLTFEPRYTFYREGSRVQPYIVGQVSRQLFRPDSGADDVDESGWAFGGGAGIAFPLMSRVLGDVSVRVASLSVGPKDFGAEFDRSGLLFELKAGLRF